MKSFRVFFWFAIMVGCILYTLIYFLAPLVAYFFRNDSVTNIIRVLGLNLIVGSLRTVPFSLLTREMRFSQRSRAEICAALIGGVTALVLAWYGFGVWSLVLNSLVSGLTLMLLCYFFCNWRPLVFFRLTLACDMVNFGAKVMVTRMQWFAYSNADFFIIGRLLGKDSLGHYTMAFNLAMLPLEKITAVINQVIYPTFSLLQNDTNELQKAFLKTTKSVSLLTFPLMALIAVFAPEIVTGLLTEKWTPAILPLRALCLVGLIRSIDVIIPQMLLARGKASLLLRYAILLLCVLPLAFIIGCYFWGINGVAYAWMLVYPPLSLCMIFLGLKESNLTMKSYIENLFPQITGIVFITILLLTVKNMAPNIFYTLHMTLAGGFFGNIILRFVPGYFS